MNPMRTLLPGVLIALAAACGASNRPPNSPPRGGSGNSISASQIEAINAVTVYEAVEKLRPQWLRSRGEQSIMSPGGGVVVYLNDTRYGDISSLRSLQANAAASILYYNAAAAQYRFGTGNTYGVIQVLTIASR